MAIAIPKAATALIVEFEGFSSRAYLDRIASPPVWTLGTGFTRGVKQGQTITRAENARRLVAELQRDYAPAVLKACKRVPNANQLSALLSFVFNVGPGGVAASTKVGRALRRGDWSAASDHLLEWCKAGGRTIYGLLRRRQAERKLMRTPVVKPRLAGYTAAEKKAITTYDDWRRRDVNLQGRKRLRREMAALAGAIERVAASRAAGGDGKGWTTLRKRRHTSLRGRS